MGDKNPSKVFHIYYSPWEITFAFALDKKDEKNES